MFAITAYVTVLWGLYTLCTKLSNASTKGIQALIITKVQQHSAYRVVVQSKYVMKQLSISS